MGLCFLYVFFFFSLFSVFRSGFRSRFMLRYHILLLLSESGLFVYPNLSIHIHHFMNTHHKAWSKPMCVLVLYDHRWITIERESYEWQLLCCSESQFTHGIKYVLFWGYTGYVKHQMRHNLKRVVVVAFCSPMIGVTAISPLPRRAEMFV